MAEVVGYDLSLNTCRKATLAMVANQLYPQAAEYKEASFWCGLRPSTPDSTPLVGATAYENLWLNTGHGTLGRSESTRLNSSHVRISYAVFCLKKKKKKSIPRFTDQFTLVQLTKC